MDYDGASSQAMMTREEAEEAVDAELRMRKLTKPMTRLELLRFCQKMHARLQPQSTGVSLSDIHFWTENWQIMWLRSN